MPSISYRGCRTLPRCVAPYARQRSLLIRRNYASITDLAQLPKIGDKIHGFTVHGTKHVPELELSAVLCHHDKTGAQHLHIARDDNNNAFSIGFKTNPPDASGVPHILEHVTLCASEKYPIRDPFFKMLPRSLNNFMNAFTSADYTMYPIATTNKTDYRNLMTMYLDATLHPLLKRFDFLQEGWRVGPEDPKAAAGSPGGDLVFKGVVYNEMKGQFSDASYHFYMRWLQEVFPSLNFYGGDPQKITDLTWEQLRQFHAEHYHPSNSKIMTYGDTPLQEHLAIIGPELDRFNRVEVDQDIKMPISIDDQTEKVTVTGPFDPMLPEGAQNKISLTWLMGDTSDIQESFALRIATNLLLDGYGSPAYKALIESGLGTDYAVNTGYDTSAATGIFSLGLNGVVDDKVAQAETVIKDVLENVYRTGFEDHKIQGLLHQLELGLKNKTPGFGLDIINRLVPGWFNGIEPLNALAWNSVVDEFKRRYAEGGYLERVLEKYLSKPYLTFVMQPTSEYAAELAADEERRLRSKIDSVVESAGGADAADQQLRDQELKLLEEQESGRSQSLDCLPTLRVSDIPRVAPRLDLDVHTLPDSPQTTVQLHRANTNGLTYFRAIAPFSITDELRPLLPLFFDSLSRIGTKSQTMGELEDKIKLYTGGIRFAHHASPLPTDYSVTEEGLLISAYSLDRNVETMYELIKTLLVETDFHSAQAKTMIRQLLQANATGAVDGIAESGHAYARRYAESGLSSHGYIAEQTAGISQVQLISRLAAYSEESPELSALVEQLASIQARLVSSLSAGARTALTCQAESTNENEQILAKFLSTFNSSSGSGSKTPMAQQTLPSTAGKTLINLPFQVYYSGLALPTYSYVDPRGAPLAVLAQLLTHKHLHHEVREKGGAYGAGAYSKGLSGMWGMYSYRDPNPENTLKVMYDAGSWARDRQWTGEELEEAKLSLFQAIDAPQAVSQEGMLTFSSGISQDLEQHRRELLLDVTKDQVQNAADWISQQMQARKDKLVVLGEKKDFVSESFTVRELKDS